MSTSLCFQGLTGRFCSLGFHYNYNLEAIYMCSIIELNTAIPVHYVPYWLFFLSNIIEQHIYYVFCLLKLDGQVLDTALVETDESETDISFDNIIVL